MSYPILVIRSPDETPDPLYPQPGTEPDSVVLSREDGEVLQFRCNGLRTTRIRDAKTVTIGELADCSATVFVIARRVVVACSKHAKGGRLRGYGAGDIVIAGVANIASQAIATHRQRGQMLVGQIRYEWLSGAIARDRKGRGSPNQIQLMMRDPTESGIVHLMLMLQLDKQDMASPYTAEIVSRAARFRAGLAQSDELKVKLEAYARSPEQSVAEGTGAITYLLPSYIAVDEGDESAAAGGATPGSDVEAPAHVESVGAAASPGQGAAPITTQVTGEKARYCGACGSQVRATSRFCGSCGAKVATDRDSGLTN